MSGLEVVGVVLGVLPLIISTVDQYRSTKRVISSFRHKEPYVDKLISALREQEYHLQGEMLLILRETCGQGFVDSISDFAETAPTLFKDPRIAHAVQDYFADGYDHYMHALSRCEESLISIVKHLDGLASGNQV